MAQFLTVKEAATLVGKSPSSIRRVIYPILEQDNHPDRQHIQPTPDEATQLRLKGENFAWRISDELLEREVVARAPAASDERGAGETGSDAQPLREVVAILREQLHQSQEQLKVKDQQIATLSEITQNLNERLREGNILMGTLQRQLSLPSGSDQPAASKQRATDVSATNADAPSAKPAAKTPKPPVKKPAKKTFFGRLFR